MKSRLTILAILLSLVLAACSLAEDITPPPGYSTPTLQSTSVPATQTPEPPPSATVTPTDEIVATVTDSTPAATDSTPAVTGSLTPSVEGSPTAQSEVVVVGGTVTLASGGSIPAGTNAILLGFDTTGGQVTQTVTETTPILPDGKYEFTNIPAAANIVFLVTVDYSGVTYDSIPVKFDGTTFQYDMPITVYDTTEDLNVLTITQAHLQFDFSTTGKVQVMALYIVNNPGGSAVVVTSDGSTVPFIQIPEGAEGAQYQLTQSSSPLLRATNGFALLPGANLQYEIITTFSLPYTKRLVFIQPFTLPVSSATVIVPEGVKVKSDQLTDAGTQNSTSTPTTTYHLYQAGSLASGSALTFTISGMPGDKSGLVLDQRTWLMIGVGALGLVLIALGIFLFLRDRKLRKMEEEFEDEEEEKDEDALGDDRESIMDAIIALDDQFKSGEILKEVYEKRREELKERLKNLT